jgi:hypothetical protein
MSCFVAFVFGATCAATYIEGQNSDFWLQENPAPCVGSAEQIQEIVD